MLKLFLINFVVAAIIRLIHHGRMDITLAYNSGDSTVSNYRIAGISGQPDPTFWYLSLPKGENYDICFSQLGFNAIVAGLQLSRFMRTFDTFTVNIYGVSVGAHVMLDIEDVIQLKATTIAINPCVSAKSLKVGKTRFFPILAMVLECLSMLMGCLAFVPIIPSEMGNCSLVLWADIMMALCFSNNDQATADVAIWSEHDELLDKSYFLERFKDSTQVYVDSGHVALADAEEAQKYQEALDSIE